LVIGLVPPAEHRERAEHRCADLASVDGRLHSLDRFEQPPLTDDCQLNIVFRSGFQHPIARFQRGCHRLLDQHMRPGRSGQQTRLFMRRMRRADGNGFEVHLAQHLWDRIERADAIGIRERLRASQLGITNGNELRFGERAERLGMSLSDLAAADQSGSDFSHRKRESKAEIFW
jgi:hypothetical protein